MINLFDIKRVLFISCILISAILTTDICQAASYKTRDVYTNEKGEVMTVESKEESFWSLKNIALRLTPVGVVNDIMIMTGKKGARTVKFCEASSTECAPYCKYNTVESCTLCPMFGVVFNTVSIVGAKAVHAFSSSVARVVVIAFGIWLAIQILAFASSIETRDLKDLMQSVITQGFLIVLVVAILQTGAANFFKTFINPVYETGQKVAQTMFSDCIQNSEGNSTVNDNGSTKCSPADMKKPETSSYVIEEPDGLPRSMGDSIIQTMTMMENRVRKFKALGSSLMCQSWKDGWFIFPKFIYLFTGLSLWVLSMLIIVGVPFLMIDSVFQLGVAAALLPVAVGCFAFKSTRQYSKKVWETFLNSMFAFIFISVVVLIILGTLQATVMAGADAIKDGGVSFDELFTPTAASKTYFDEIMMSFQWASPHFLKLAFIFILAWSVMSMAKDFAGEFASSISNTSIGSSIGTMAASTGKGMALKAAKPMASAIGDGISRGSMRLARGVRHIYRRNKMNNERSKFSKYKEVDGKKTYTDKKGRVHTLENGAITTRERKGGKEIVTTKTENITIVRTKQTKMINGRQVEVYNDNVKLNNDKLRDIIGADGKVNVKEMTKFLDGLKGEQRKLAQVTLLKATIEKRVSRDGHDYKKADNLAPPEVVKIDENSGEMVIKEMTANGEVVFSKMKLNNGYLETSVTKINAKGKVTRLSSDGIRNRMETFKLADGVDASKLSNIEDVYAKRDRNRDIKRAYSYTKYWQDRLDEGFDENRIDQGFMSDDEIQRDANGRIIGGAFVEFTRRAGNEFQKADIAFKFR